MHACVCSRLQARGVAGGASHQVRRGTLLLYGGQAGEGVVLADGAHGAALALLLLRDLAEALVLLVFAGVLAVETARLHEGGVRTG